MKLIPLNRGMFAQVDDEDFDQVMSAGCWTASPSLNTFYAVRAIRTDAGKRTTQSMHQFITRLDGVDHIDRDGLNNQRGNLRQATTSQNAANARMWSNNTSGYRGVSWNRQSKRWYAAIKVMGRTKSLGYFDDAAEAAVAYDLAAMEHFGEFAYRNFPDVRRGAA